ncbi:MAG: hypothetical protein KAK00_01240 [Nanoarchaeota archaeon]|nr:hypothetical protein [Nanoarchaeota archaeon]
MITTDVIGANRTNESAVTKVWVWNTEPNITSMVVSPSPIDLTPGNVTIVTCTAYVWDYNGWQDVTIVKSSFYDINEGDGTTADKNYRYLNSTCGNCTSADSSGTNASCSCQFGVWYFANNGTWECNMTIRDRGGNATTRIHLFNDTMQSGSIILNSILGVDISEGVIDYGNLSVTELSDPESVNITNWGNVPINISVREWGGTEESETNVGNFSMLCDYGNITHGYQRYSTSNFTDYTNMTNVTNTSTVIPNWNLPVRTNDTHIGKDRNQTFWRIKIPLTVGGFCNGTIMFSGTEYYN